MKTVWSVFRNFVNSKEIGQEITRKEILAQMDKNFLNIKNTMYDAMFIVPRYSDANVDCQINMSKKSEYLGKTIKVGVYKVLKHFDPAYSLSQLRKELK